MNFISRTITGIVFIIVGLILIGVSILESLFILIYAIPIIVIGGLILFNKKEDFIEPARSRKSKGGKNE